MDEDDPEPDDGHGEDLGDVQVEEVQGMDVEPKEEDLERSISETLNELSPYDVPSQAWKEDFFSKEGADQVDQVDDQGVSSTSYISYLRGMSYAMSTLRPA